MAARAKPLVAVAAQEAVANALHDVHCMRNQRPNAKLLDTVCAYSDDDVGIQFKV